MNYPYLIVRMNIITLTSQSPQIKISFNSTNNKIQKKLQKNNKKSLILNRKKYKPKGTKNKKIITKKVLRINISNSRLWVKATTTKMIKVFSIPQIILVKKIKAGLREINQKQEEDPTTRIKMLRLNLITI